MLCDVEGLFAMEKSGAKDLWLHGVDSLGGEGGWPASMATSKPKEKLSLGKEFLWTEIQNDLKEKERNLQIRKL